MPRAVIRSQRHCASCCPILVRSSRARQGTLRIWRDVQDLNAQFDGSLRKLMCRKLRPHVDEAILISIDKLGADVRVRVGSDYSVERIGWQNV